MFMCLFLFALWLIFNARITPEVCLFGVVIVGGIYAFCVYALGYSPRHEKGLVKRIGLYLWYILCLVGEILKANFAVMRIILIPPHKYDPAVVRIRVPLKHNSSRVILSNSITLTPGTVTVSQKGEDEYLVLCLNKQDAYDIPRWNLVRLLHRIEEDDKWN